MDEKIFLKYPALSGHSPGCHGGNRELTADRVVRGGDYLFREGEPGEHLYVVREGELEVVLAPGSADEMFLKLIGPGEYVGEMGLILKDGRRTATVRSRTAAKAWVMSRALFNDLIAALARVGPCHGQHLE